MEGSRDARARRGGLQAAVVSGSTEEERTTLCYSVLFFKRCGQFD